MKTTEVTIFFQFGLLRDEVTVDSSQLTLKSLKEFACDFINNKLPDHGLVELFDRILLFKHAYNSPNILEFIANPMEIVQGTLVEIVLASQVPSEQGPIQPHVLSAHTFKFPAFCNICGDMIYGLIRQGLKCKECSKGYHHRCMTKVSNDCSQNSCKNRRG